MGKTTAGAEIELKSAGGGGYGGKSNLSGDLAGVDQLEATDAARRGGEPTGGEGRPARGDRLPEQDSGEYAVVLCDVRPEVVRSQSFVRLLISNGIAMQGAEAEPPADLQMGRQEPATLRR